MAFLKVDKTLICILSKYAEFANVFFKNLVVELPKHTKINNYSIDLIHGYEPLYKLIHSIQSVELETLKTYIKTNITNGYNFLNFL